MFFSSKRHPGGEWGCVSPNHRCGTPRWLGAGVLPPAQLCCCSGKDWSWLLSFRREPSAREVLGYREKSQLGLCDEWHVGKIII